MTPHYKYRCHVTGEIYIIAEGDSPAFPQDKYLGTC